MTDTTTITITAAWTKISDGQCEVQSINDQKSYDKLLFDLVVSDEEPASDTDAFMMINLNEHANFCLLYTSPSPRDGLLSRMPSSA